MRGGAEGGGVLKNIYKKSATIFISHNKIFMEKENKKSVSVFDEFVGKYEFSKTLQFGLVPLKMDDSKEKIIEDGNLSILRKYNIVETDVKTAESIKTAKFYLNIFHREVIDNALKILGFRGEDLKKYVGALEAIRKNSKNGDLGKEQKKKISKELRNNLSRVRDVLLKEIGNVFKNAGNETLLSKDCLIKLKDRFTQQKVNELRSENKDKGIEYPEVVYSDGKSVFEMNAGYLDDFHKNRELLYSIKNKKGSLGQRILSNFELFYKNIKTYEEKYKNSDIDFSEASQKLQRMEENEEPGIFDLDFYNKCLTQEGIDKYAEILGGKTHKQERKTNVLGLNQIINLYTQKKQNEHKENQKQKGQKKKKFNKKDYPIFSRLQKQILSEVFRKEIFIESDLDIIRELKFFLAKSVDKVAKAKDLIAFFLDHDKKGINLAQVYLSKSKISGLVNKVFKEPQSFMAVFRNGVFSLDFVSFDIIKTHFENNKLEYKDFFRNLVENRNGFEDFLFLLKHEIELLIEGGETMVRGGKKENIIALTKKKSAFEEKLKWFEEKVERDEKMKDEEEGEFCLAVLGYSQAISDIARRAEIFWLNEKQNVNIGEDNKDTIFYKKFDEFVGDDFVPFFYFDRFGSYLKRRSRNTTREIKLHFGNDHLLDGWDINKEPDYHGFLLRDRNEYYLGVGNKRGDLFHKKLGKSVEEVREAYNTDGKDFYEKIDYKQLDIGKFEGVAFGKGNDKKTPDELAKKKRELADEFLDGDIKKLEYYFQLKKEYDDFKTTRQEDKAWDRRFSKDKMRKLIEYYITCLGKREDWRRFNLEFKKPEEYKDRDDFVAHIQRQAYWIKPNKVSKKYIHEKVISGELFLFRIHNKDFYDFEKKSSNKNPYTKDGSPSAMHLFTRYFLELFSDENISNIKSKNPNKSIYELDGKAEIRFKPKTDNVKLRIYQKNKKDVTFFDERDGNKEKKVIQHRRFAKDTLTLHLKTRLNFGKQTDLFTFNKIVNGELLTKVPVKILGMDRGENNLIYYCILNERGEIEDEKCASLNKVGERKLENGKKEPVDYFQLLVNREGQRDWEQKNWQKITPIKDLKAGYLGNVLHWISEETFAGIDRGVATLNVLEDLGGSFKRTRFFRERQVYQGFENKLVKKLGYLVDKNCGNFRNAYQFTPIIDSVEEMEKNKQIGTVIYVPASYTSKICPHSLCGWRKRLYVKNSYSKEKIIGLLESMKIQIAFDKGNDRFCFEYEWEQEYKDNGKKETYGGIDKVFSSVSRMQWNDNQNKMIEFKDGTKVSITSKLKDLFEQNRIQLTNINKQLVDRKKELAAELFQNIIFYFNLIMQIRNYDREKEGGDADYIQCPSCLFDSRKSEGNGKLSLITNGDANGAYNIARKGFMQLCRIRKNPDDPMKLITNKDWDEAVCNWDAYIIKCGHRKME